MSPPFQGLAPDNQHCQPPINISSFLGIGHVPVGGLGCHVLHLCDLVVKLT